jgi:hypothetical protein
MKITNQIEKLQIRNQFIGFIQSKGYNLSNFCDAFGLDYMTVYKKLNKYKNMELDEVNDYIALLDKKKKVQLIAGKYVISAKF